MTVEEAAGGQPDSGRLSRLWAQVSEEAAARGGPVDLDGLCRSAAAQLRVGSVAVSVPSVGLGAETIAGFGPLARVAEELQITVGEGPTLETLAGSGPLLVEDLAAVAAQGRWPLFAPGAVAAGVCALYAVPIRIGAARFGAFAVYLDRPGRWDPDLVADAIGYAALALELLLNGLNERIDAEHALLEQDGSTDEAQRLGRAVERRPLEDHLEVHQATGMISAQLGVDMPTALLRLRARAFADGRLLSELAADVVARTLRFEEAPGGDA